MIESTVYDQVEVAIPVDRMADCLAGILDVIYGSDLEGEDEELRMADKGFRVTPLFRFVGREDGLLSPTNDVPRMYLNLEDYLSYNSVERSNKQFVKLLAFLRGSSVCSARLHWGKAGWPDEGCWHGAEEYPDSWCDFGCAVRALDPTGKFTDSASDRWNWEGGSSRGMLYRKWV